MSEQQSETLVERWIRPEIRQLQAYRVLQPLGMIKLDAMENPHTWPEELRKEWANQLQEVHLNRYPSPKPQELKEQLQQAFGVPQGMDIILGNGSDEIIQMIALAMSGPSRCLLSVEPSFVMYSIIASFVQMDYVGVPLQSDDFTLDLPPLLKAIKKHQPAVIFLAYPNNPTGNLFDEEAVVEVIQAAPGLVVIDEAYAPFANASFLDRLGEFPNLAVMRTLSKMGLAGLRLGLLAGPVAWLSEIDKIRLPYNINTLTQHSAHFALTHQELFEAQTKLICAQRGRLLAELGSMEGVECFPSDANFILVRLPDDWADPVYRGLWEHNIQIKKLHGSHPLLNGCLRITVGTENENTQFLATFEKVLQSQKAAS